MWELVENKISIFSCCQHLTLQGILSLLHQGLDRLFRNPIKPAHLDFFLENQGKKIHEPAALDRQESLYRCWNVVLLHPAQNILVPDTAALP